MTCKPQRGKSARVRRPCPDLCRACPNLQRPCPNLESRLGHGFLFPGLNLAPRVPTSPGNRRSQPFHIGNVFRLVFLFPHECQGKGWDTGCEVGTPLLLKGNRCPNLARRLGHARARLGRELGGWDTPEIRTSIVADGRSIRPGQATCTLRLFCGGRGPVTGKQAAIRRRSATEVLGSEAAIHSSFAGDDDGRLSPGNAVRAAVARAPSGGAELTAVPPNAQQATHPCLGEMESGMAGAVVAVIVCVMLSGAMAWAAA